MRTKRILAATLLGALLTTIGVALLLSRSSPTEKVGPESRREPSSTPSEEEAASVEVVSSEPGVPFRLVFDGVEPDGELLAKVENRSEAAAFIQCLIEAVDGSGESVLSRTYESYREDGEVEEVEAYTAFVSLDPGASIFIDVHLPVDGPIARVSANCEERPPPPSENV